ncbi:hypothetical protein BH18ACT15_BH18ACT15_02970 [soil metagenome]
MGSDKLIGITEARDRLKDLVEEVKDRKILILRHNRPVAALVDPERLDALIDRVEDLEDYISVLEHKYESEGTVSVDELRQEFESARPKEAVRVRLTNTLIEDPEEFSAGSDRQLA